MSTEQPDRFDAAERTEELLAGAAAVRDLRLERAQTDEERAKVLADHEVISQMLRTMLHEPQEEHPTQLGLGETNTDTRSRHGH